jgi:hypothetical protein
VKIWINRAGQNLGTLDSEEVQRGLDSGQYLPTDLGWREGTKNWKPLSEFPELRLLRAQVPAVQLPVSGAAQAAPQQPTEVVERAEAAPAWERRRQTGFGKALFTTWKEVLFYPGTTFGQLKSSGGFAAPLLFQAIMTTLLMAVLAIFRTVGVTIGWPAEPTLLYYAGPILVGVPLSIGLNFVLAGVFHFCLMLMKGKSKAYEATYRVTSYCSSAYVFGVIPFFGLYVSWIWGLICMAVGLQKVHKTEGWRATIAVLIPVVAHCGFVLVLLSVVFFLIGFHSRAS